MSDTDEQKLIEKRRDAYRKWYAKNPEKARQHHDKWLEKNRDKWNAYCRDYNSKNVEQINERRKRWLAKKPDFYKKRWQKIKADPVRYERHLARQRERYRLRMHAKNGNASVENP